MKSPNLFPLASIGGKVFGVFLAGFLINPCCRETLVIAEELLREVSGRNQTNFGLQGTPAKPQDKLSPGEPLSRQIKGGETHVFAISLASGEFAKFAIEQHGSILQATLFDPQNAEVIQMDSPAGGHGPIYLSAIASLSGTYRLEIRSTNNWANRLSYKLLLEKLRSHEFNDLALIEAEKAFAEGRKNFRAEKASAALQYYDRALVYWRTSRNHHWQALTEYARSEAYRNVDRQRAEASLNETLRILGFEMAQNDWRLKASALNDLGPIYGAAGNNERALSVLSEALSLFVSHHDRRGQASALGNLARLHGRTGNLSLSRELIENALVLRKAENDKPGEINLLNSLGAISDQLGEPDKALAYFTQALAGWESMEELRPSDRARVAAVLNNLATASDKLDNWDLARDYYDKALAKYNEHDPNRATTLDNKGELYAALGDNQKARECYDEALTILASITKPDPDVKAGLLVHIGQLSMSTGDHTTALVYFEEARSAQPNPPKMADVLRNLGEALAAQGKLQKAMEAYQSALEIQLKLRDRRGQALTLSKRAEAHALLGQQSDALNDLKLALVFLKEIKDKRGEAATLNGIARLEQSRGNLAQAFANSSEAVKIIEALRTRISNRQLRTSYFATRKNYYEFDIDLKMQLGRLANQPEYSVKAFESSEKARARVLIDALAEAGVGRSESNLTSDPRLVRLIEDRSLLLGKISAKATARTNLLSAHHTPSQITSLDKEIDKLTEKYDDLEARLRAQNPRFAGLTNPQPSSLEEIQQQLGPDTLLVEYSLGEKRSYVWVVSAYSIKGIKLAERAEIEQAALLVTKAITTRNLEVKNESWQEKQLRIAKSETEYSEAAAALTNIILEPIAPLLGDKRLIVVADGALQLVPFSSLPAPGGAVAANHATPSGQNTKTIAAQSFLVYDHEIVTLPSASVLVLQRRELLNRKSARFAVAVLADPVFDRQDARVARARGNGNQHRKGVAGTPRKHSSKIGPGPALLPKLGELSEMPEQSGPIESKQSNQGALLKNGGAGVQPIQTPQLSASTAAPPKEQTVLASALRNVGLDPNRPVPRLPYSLREAKAILQAAGANQSFSALDFKASRATATSPELSKYRIIHFATHGILDLEHPELSGIVLSMVDENGQKQDGYLRLHEIYNLNLPAELIVLSACQTGVGKQIKGEGLIALTRGFMYAGAKSIVASLWKVDDAATSALMAEFYKQMFVNKLKPAAALREAQLKISQDKRWGSPYYWAGFFLQGDWN